MVDIEPEVEKPPLSRWAEVDGGASSSLSSHDSLAGLSQGLRKLILCLKLWGWLRLSWLLWETFPRHARPFVLKSYVIYTARLSPLPLHHIHHKTGYYSLWNDQAIRDYYIRGKLHGVRCQDDILCTYMTILYVRTYMTILYAYIWRIEWLGYVQRWNMFV